MDFIWVSYHAATFFGERVKEKGILIYRRRSDGYVTNV